MSTRCDRLLRDLARSEATARRYPRRFARRLRDSEPSAALADFEVHAVEVAGQLAALGAEPGWTAHVTHWVARLGHAILDPLVSPERAYRDALVELRRGLDTARLLREIAVHDRETAIVKFCDLYLVERGCLLETLEQAVAWFAQDLDVAPAQLAKTAA